MVTTSLKGHFPPFVQLLYRLADFWRLQSPHDTCIVTVVGVKEDLLDLKRLQFDGAFRGVDLRLLEMCVEIFQSGNPKRPIDPLIQTKMFQDAFEPLQQKMIEEKKNGGLEIPTCLIPDFLLTFTKASSSLRIRLLRNQHFRIRLHIYIYIFFQWQTQLSLELKSPPFSHNFGSDLLISYIHESARHCN